MINAFRVEDALPAGPGMQCTSSSSNASIPVPAFALTRGALRASRPMISSISLITRSGAAEARSILFNTGRTSRSLSMAVRQFATLCASTPWAASTTSKAPSQAARERETS